MRKEEEAEREEGEDSRRLDVEGKKNEVKEIGGDS